MARTQPPGDDAALTHDSAAPDPPAPARRPAPRNVFATAWAALVGRPEPLPPALVARYPELAAARWRRGGLALRVGGWCLGQSTVHGITLGRTVHLAPGVGHPPGLLLHELAHVHQFARDRGFPVRYAWESLRRGYARNRYEVEADAFAHEALARAREAGRLPAGDAAPPNTPR